MKTRKLVAPDGTEWEAFATPAIVAHGRSGMALAFRLSGLEGDTVQSTVTFNSAAAADFALESMSDKEIGRRLSLARQSAASV